MTAATDTKKLATQGTNALAAIPEHLKKFAGVQDGKENLGRDDVLIPRLGLAQQNNTPQLDEDNELYIEDLEAGELFNTVTSEIYGSSVTIVPLFMFKNYIEFKPMDEGGGILAQYENKEDVPAEGLEWGTDGEKPKVTEFRNYMSLIRNEAGAFEPIVVSFKSTGIKMAKKLAGLIKLIPLPAYGRQYVLEVRRASKGQLKWYMVNPKAGEFVSEELFHAAKTYFDSLQDKGFKVDTTGLDPDDEPAEVEGDVSFDSPQQTTNN